MTLNVWIMSHVCLQLVRLVLQLPLPVTWNSAVKGSVPRAEMPTNPTASDS